MLFIVRNLSVLSDIEFEEVAADLLAAEYKVNVERFSRGPDGGIDLRWQTADAEPGIGQCKHYPRSTFSHLLAAARAEVSHLESMTLSQYRFITSMDLTRNQKDQIHDVLGRWLMGPENVLSGGDLDRLLARHPNVDRSHPKLWLSSGAQLFWESHSEIAHRSAALRSRITNSLPRYVLNEGFHAAQQLLETNKVCIIAGLPGIGKTTLAHVLVASAMAKNYEPIEVSGDIEEGWAALQSGERQVFLYDDFLGQLSFSERLGKNEDRRLTDFITRVRSTESKLLVMTTREYILQDARRTYALLDELDQRMHFVLELDDYTRGDRSRILYNHLWQADISQEALIEISRGGYRRIVQHQNYNPRLIEYATGPAFDTKTDGYVERFVEVLDNPTQLWSRAFETHLTDEQRILAVVLATLPKQANLDDLLSAHTSMCNLHNVPTSASSCRIALQVMEGTFIAIIRSEHETQVQFHNPSIREFILSWIAADSVLIERLIDSAVFFEQVSRLYAHTFQGVGSATLRAEFERHGELFCTALERLVMSPSPERRSEWATKHGLRYQRPSGWFEQRLGVSIAMRHPFKPSNTWVVTQIAILAGRWTEGKGNKGEALRVLRDLTIQAATRSLDADEKVMEDAWTALSIWLADEIVDTDNDLMPYFDWLESECGGVPLEAVDRFEEFARGEVERWHPSPPDSEYLLRLAEEFNLEELVEKLREADKRAQQEWEEEEERQAQPVESPLNDPRNVVDMESFASLDKLFARLTVIQ